jgi:UDP-glucose 4-epimerase
MKNNDETRKTILVTGVAGFLGRYIAQYFHGQGWNVIGIDSGPPENASLSNLTTYYSLKLPNAVLGDILKNDAPDVCIHCAGRASVPQSVVDPSADYYASAVLTFDVLENLRNHAPGCKFIFLSSAAVYGNPQSLPVSEEDPAEPISPYGFHKLHGELLCKEFARVYGLRTASVRIFSAYGPGLRRQVLWDICRKIIIDRRLQLQGTGQESRDFIHARDIAKAVHIVATKATMNGEVFNLASGREVTILNLAELVLAALKADCTPQFDGVIPPGTPLNWCAEISKLRSLGFESTVPLEKGIETYASWCRAELMGI